MKRPLAYITAPWSEDKCENAKIAARYCRQVYDAGYSPVCPTMFLPLFLTDSIPQEHTDGIDMARDYLRRARVLVVCGDDVTESMKDDIAIAERLHITATTLDGILTVKGQGRDKSKTHRYDQLCFALNFTFHAKVFHLPFIECPFLRLIALDPLCVVALFCNAYIQRSGV